MQVFITPLNGCNSKRTKAIWKKVFANPPIIQIPHLVLVVVGGEEDDDPGGEDGHQVEQDPAQLVQHEAALPLTETEVQLDTGWT